MSKGQRLLGGAVARGEQLLVEVEEDDRVGAAHAVQNGLGADEDRTTVEDCIVACRR